MHKTETKKTALRKHPILLALIYAKYACNKFYLFYHDYTINSIVIIITTALYNFYATSEVDEASLHKA